MDDIFHLVMAHNASLCVNHEVFSEVPPRCIFQPHHSAAFTVCTFNVNGLETDNYPARVSYLNSFLSSWNPTIVCFQEVVSTFHDRLAHTLQPAYFFLDERKHNGATRPFYFNTVWIRADFVAADSVSAFVRPFPSDQNRWAACFSFPS